MYGTHYGPASVHYVAHCPHHNSSSTGVQTCARVSQYKTGLVDDEAALPPVTCLSDHEVQIDMMITDRQTMLSRPPTSISIYA